MKRLRLYDIRMSRLPNTVGLCESDMIGIARLVNSAQQRLLYCREAGDEGWYGTWAEIVFNVSRDEPYITFPRSIARIQSVNVCESPVMVQNQFYEYLRFGNGRLPKTYYTCNAPSRVQVLSRNHVPSFRDLHSPPKILRVYSSDASDNGRRILLQGTDIDGKEIYTQDTLARVSGVFVVFEVPFVDVPMQFRSITGIQKDITAGPIEIWEVDPTTGDEALLTTLEAGEETAWYRRYYLDQLPCGCCNVSTNTTTCPTVQVTAIAKLELLPVRVDVDYLLIQNLEAIIEECQSIRYSEMDVTDAKAMSQERHNQAVRFLNGEITHYLGKNTPAISFAPFGTARLENQKIGSLV